MIGLIDDMLPMSRVLTGTRKSHTKMTRKVLCINGEISVSCFNLDFEMGEAGAYSAV